MARGPVASTRSSGEETPIVCIAVSTPASRGNLTSVNWLVVSLIASVALTLLLNVALRAFPGAGRWIGRRMEDLGSSTDERDGERRMRVWFPWKSMLVASLLLTVVLNLLLWFG